MGSILTTSATEKGLAAEQPAQKKPRPSLHAAIKGFIPQAFSQSHLLGLRLLDMRSIGRLDHFVV